MAMNSRIENQDVTEPNLGELMAMVSEARSDFEKRIRNIAESYQLDAKSVDEWITMSTKLCWYDSQIARGVVSGLQKSDRKDMESTFASCIGGMSETMRMLSDAALVLLKKESHQLAAATIIELIGKHAVLQQSLIAAWPWKDSRRAAIAREYFEAGGKGIPLQVIVNELRD